MAAMDENLDEIMSTAAAVEEDTGKEVEFLPLLPQLSRFIEEESGKARNQHRPATFFFEEGGRKGYMICQYVWNGAYIFAVPKDGEPIKRKLEPVLNITHVVIQKNGGEKNIVDRISKEVLASTPISGVRIESIMSDKWLKSFTTPWEPQNTDNVVLFKGGKRKRKTVRRKNTYRSKKR